MLCKIRRNKLTCLQKICILKYLKIFRLVVQQALHTILLLCHHSYKNTLSIFWGFRLTETERYVLHELSDTVLAWCLCCVHYNTPLSCSVCLATALPHSAPGSLQSTSCQWSRNVPGVWVKRRMVCICNACLSHYPLMTMNLWVAVFCSISLCQDTEISKL